MASLQDLGAGRGKLWNLVSSAENLVEFVVDGRANVDVAERLRVSEDARLNTWDSGVDVRVLGNLGVQVVANEVRDALFDARVGDVVDDVLVGGELVGVE